MALHPTRRESGDIFFGLAREYVITHTASALASVENIIIESVGNEEVVTLNAEVSLTVPRAVVNEWFNAAQEVEPVKVGPRGCNECGAPAWGEHADSCVYTEEE